jgi:hypothetical protein
MPSPAETSLTAVLVLATAVWIGGLVAIFVTARVAHATLGVAERVTFFRGLGRAYGPVGGVALAVAAALVAVTAAGVVQARRMARLRQDALRAPSRPELTARVRRGARSAAVLRATIAAEPGAAGPRSRCRDLTLRDLGP